MENVTLLLEKRLGCELEMMGFTDSVVRNFTNLLLLRRAWGFVFFSPPPKSHFSKDDKVKCYISL